MGSAGAGIVFFLSAAVSTGTFAWRARQKGKRPGVASILVAILLVPFFASSIVGIVTLPVSAIATRVPGLSVVVNLLFVVVMIGACAAGGYVLASIMGVPRQQEAGEVLRGTQLATSDRWRKRTDWMRTPAITVAGLAIDRADEPKHFVTMGTTGTGKSVAIREMLRGRCARRSGDHCRSRWRFPLALLLRIAGRHHPQSLRRPIGDVGHDGRDAERLRC